MSKIITWAVYDHPVDFPDFYVARKLEGMEPTKDFIKRKLIIDLQLVLVYMGLVRLSRTENNEAQIVEVWF